MSQLLLFNQPDVLNQRSQGTSIAKATNDEVLDDELLALDEDKKKPVFVLSNLKIPFVSLVDKPAVPKAFYRLIKNVVDDENPTTIPSIPNHTNHTNYTNNLAVKENTVTTKENTVRIHENSMIKDDTSTMDITQIEERLSQLTLAIEGLVDRVDSQQQEVAGIKDVTTQLETLRTELLATNGDVGDVGGDGHKDGNDNGEPSGSDSGDDITITNDNTLAVVEDLIALGEEVDTAFDEGLISTEDYESFYNDEYNPVIQPLLDTVSTDVSMLS